MHESFKEGFETPSGLTAKRKALAQVRDILSPHGDFFVVMDGASITHSTKPGIIKDFRKQLMEHEKSLGQNPRHDWGRSNK
jgi:hypothetical protein